MNPATEPNIPQLQPPNPPQPHRPSTSCDRHPDENFTGFCPSCLCERLAVLEPSSTPPPSRKPPSAAAAAIKAIFKPSAAAGPSSSSSFLPELRRTKSFSASKNEGLFSGIFEPQRKSCDVRARNTLWNLFSIDDDTKAAADVEARNSASSSSIHRCPLPESKEEDAETDAEKPSDVEDQGIQLDDEIRALEEARKSNVVGEDRVPEIVEEVEEEEEQNPPPPLGPEDLRSMKDHINLDSSNPKKPSSGRDFKDIAGSFWSAASVFSKKLQKWRRKQKLKKQREAGGGGCSSTTLPVEKPISRQFRETQSEIADYGFGRRSCDTDPRFSLDAGRISFDDPRYSFDEPRASWDGYLIGRSFPPPPRMGPTMVSVVEDSPPVNHVLRTDTQIPVEDPSMNSIDEEDDGVPGGSAQTRDYYLDSSSKRRKSLDRSSSIRKTAAAVVAEIDELKSAKNAKVSPATVDYFQGPKLIVGERDLRDLRDLRESSSLRDDCSDMFEIGFRDNASVIGNGDRKGAKKSSRWKAWNIWAFIHRRGGNKDENDDRYSNRGNGVERSFSESWQDRNGDPRLAFNRKVLRSNSSVSSRNSYSLGGSFGRKNGSLNGIEMNGHGRKKRDEFVLERNRSARYSPNNVDNGLLRFYLTPLRGSRRGVGGGGIGVGPGKGRAGPAQSIARSVLRL